MSNKDKNLFDKAMDEAFDAIVKGRIEDVTKSVKNLTQRIEQEVNTSRSEPDSVESVVLNACDSLALAEALVNPPQPNASLREAANRYRAQLPRLPSDKDEEAMCDDIYPPIG